MSFLHMEGEWLGEKLPGGEQGSHPMHTRDSPDSPNKKQLLNKPRNACHSQLANYVQGYS